MRARAHNEHRENGLWRLARAQWGVFSRQQAFAVGLSRGVIAARVTSGSWVRVLPGVYRAATNPESWHQRLMAACLWAGDGAVVSHLTAARLHGLEGLPYHTVAGLHGLDGPGVGKGHEPIELTVPMGTQVRASGLLVHRSRRLDRADRSAIEGIPVTSLARTLVDLSATLDEKHLSMALDSGLARHPSVDVGMLRRALRRLRTKGRSGTGALERLLAERAPDAVHLDSALERRFAFALRRAGLPRPSEHYDVVEDGRRLAELDFAYPRQRLGIQLHGAGIHRRSRVWERDQDQQAELAAAGWLVVPVTWKQLEASESAVMDRLARALARRSQ